MALFSFENRIVKKTRLAVRRLPWVDNEKENFIRRFEFTFYRITAKNDSGLDKSGFLQTCPEWFAQRYKAQHINTSTMGERFAYLIGWLFSEPADTLNTDGRIIFSNISALRNNYKKTLYIIVLEVLVYLRKRILAREIILTEQQRQNFNEIFRIS